MAAFNAIIVGAVGGVLLVFLWHLAALLFLVGWAGSAVLILKA